jgi:hypothetical protein
MAEAVVVLNAVSHKAVKPDVDQADGTSDDESRYAPGQASSEECHR